MTRLDQALVQTGLARSRVQAQELIGTGRVLVNGVVVRRAAHPVRPDDAVSAAVDPYVSRGAHKLLGALEDLSRELGPGQPPELARSRALDAGASTGGFTQVLLEHGCRRVYAVDVGTGQLSAVLRGDPRVVVRERTNLRDLTLDRLDGAPVELVVADVSFISLTLVLGPLIAVTAPDGELIVLVKPQFEVGRGRLGKGGVVLDPELHRSAVDTVAACATGLGWPPVAEVPSRTPGPAGNREFFLLLRRAPTPAATESRPPVI